MSILGAVRRAPDAVLSHFHVGSASAADLPAIDGLRAMAVVMIFLLHSWGSVGQPDLDVEVPLLGTFPLSGWLHRGDLGVPLFFILSGFLLAQPFLRAAYTGAPRPSLRTYSRRRILRIVPAYYACLFLMLVLLTPTLINYEYVYSWVGLKELVTHLTFTHFWFIETSGSWGVNGPMWTLTHEATFYVVLPMVAVLFAGRRNIVALPVALALSAGYLYLAHNSLDFVVRHAQEVTEGEIYFNEENIRNGYVAPQFPAHLFNFALGITLANVLVATQLGRLPKPGAMVSGMLFLAGLGLFVGSVQYSYFESPDFGAFFIHVGTPTDSLGFALMLAGLMFGAPVARQIFAAAPVRLVGIVSYSLFLWHVPLLLIMARFPTLQEIEPGERLIWVILWATPLVLAVSIASYLFIEKPFLVASRRRAPAVPQPEPVQAPVEAGAEEGVPQRRPAVAAPVPVPNMVAGNPDSVT